MLASLHGLTEWRVRPATRHASTRRTFNAVAALAASLMLIVAAAMPNADEEAVTSLGAGAPGSTALHPDRETNFGAYLGAPYHYPSDFWLTKNGRHDFRIKNVEWFTKPFDNPLYYGVRLQRWFTGGRFGTMIDFVHSKAYAPFEQTKPFSGTLDGQPAPAEGKPGAYFSKLEWSHGHNMLTLNGLMRVFQVGRFAPYAGLGAGVSLPHSEIHLLTDPARTYEYQYAGLNMQALFGLEVRLKTGSVFVEYKFTDADYSGPVTHTDGSWLPLDLSRQFARWWKGEDPPGGFAGARLTSHQVVGGFLFRFVPRPAVAAGS